MTVFETHVMDQQKRTTINQLTSSSCLVLIFGNLTFLPVIAWRVLIGPLKGLPMAMFGVYAAFYTHIMLFYLISEISVLKCLYMSKWSLMARVNDDFLATTLKSVSFTFSILALLTRILLQEYDSNIIISFLLNKPADLNNHLQNQPYFWTTVAPCLLLMAVAIIANVIAVCIKAKHACQTRASNVIVAANQPGLNNVQLNQPVISYKGSIIIIITAMLPFFVMRFFIGVNEISLATTIFSTNTLTCIVYPSIYFIQKPAHFKSACHEMLEMLQRTFFSFAFSCCYN